MPACEKLLVNSGDKIRFTPPTMARSHSPFLILEQARCIATKEEEQAVSTLREGPRKSKI